MHPLAGLSQTAAHATSPAAGRGRQGWAGLEGHRGAFDQRADGERRVWQDGNSFVSNSRAKSMPGRVVLALLWRACSSWRWNIYSSR